MAKEKVATGRAEGKLGELAGKMKRPAETPASTAPGAPITNNAGGNPLNPNGVTSATR